MKTRAELKNAAHDNLRGNWTSPVLATLLYVVFSALTEIPFVGILISLLIILPMAYSYTLLFLDFIRGDKEKLIEKLFGFFKDYGRAFGTAFMVALYTLLWSLLLIIPGIIKTYAYSMTYFISKDHPEYSIDACIEASKKMMYGHKWELFVLQLSFIGWFLLSILTLGIGLLWVIPYYQTTFAHYYEELKAETEAEPLQA